MPLQKEIKTKLITDFHRHDTDTGSPEVQIAILTGRIQPVDRAPARQQKRSVLPAWTTQNGWATPPLVDLPAQVRLSALSGSYREFEPAPQVVRR